MARPQDANEVFTSLWAPSRYGRRVSAQRTQSEVAADHRSIIPKIPGVPWWAAVVMGVTGAAVGFAFDAGSGKELTVAFAALYVAGCAAAVLTVRQSGIFTAVIQPPLILFCAVPGAYWLFHGAKYTGLKDLLINCGYPLIERFPLMLFTSAGVLIVGLIRWYLGMAVRTHPKAATDDATKAAAALGAHTAAAGRSAGFVTRLTALFGRDATDDETVDKGAKPRPRREHAVARSAKSARSTERTRTGKRPPPSRARRVRPPLDEADETPRQRAQRRRTIDVRESDAPELPRRSWAPRDPDLRDRPAREVRRDPRRGRPTSRNPYAPADPQEPVERYAPREQRRRPAPNGATATHHPISRVRYRNEEPPAEPTSRPQRPRKTGTDSWEYDV